MFFLWHIWLSWKLKYFTCFDGNSPKKNYWEFKIVPYAYLKHMKKYVLRIWAKFITRDTDMQYV